VPERYLDSSLDRLLEDVAARTPAPGGGSVAAITLAFAAGLVAMSARFSNRQLPDSGELADELDVIRHTAGALADADADAYAEVLSTGRSNEAVLRATEIPLEVCEQAAAVAERAARVVTDGNPNLRGDAMTGLQLAAAAVRSAAYLVRLNADAADGLDAYPHRAEEYVAKTAHAMRRSGG
jgi:methenyltetrahydrofolate cyclohydrolase